MDLIATTPEPAVEPAAAPAVEPQAEAAAAPVAATPKVAGKPVPSGVERWKNNRRGRVWYETTDARSGNVTTRFVRGGQEFEIRAVDVERAIAQCSRPEESAFVSGVLKRVDNRIASPEDAPEVQEQKQQTPLPEGYDPAKVLGDEEIKAVLKKSGMAFHTAVKKLTHPQVRQLAILIDEENAGDGEGVTVKQAEFVKEYIRTHVTQTKMTKMNSELNDDGDED